ncbi:MAG: ATP-dependent DNA helicase [Candidatus Woesearchaeota archaeon]|nr:ATP-dependent DNA helicase [Candidatus Woesearchaeota archaeon]
MEEDFFFPYKKVREFQRDMINDVIAVLNNKKCLIAHAPTGLGKTIAVLGPALKYAIDNNKTIFFLTSRHTQHNIVIETIIQIRKKYSIEFSVADIIGKKWMCAMPGIEMLTSKDFADFCKAVREDRKCEFYERTKDKNKLAPEAKLIVEHLKKIKDGKDFYVENIVETCKEKKLCPYEISIALASEARVIITDYSYIFNSSIRENFFSKTKKELKDSIIIIDEGHNLPRRIRDLASEKISTLIIRRAIKEAKKFNYEKIAEQLSFLNEILLDYKKGLKEAKEKIIKKDDFIKKIEGICNYDELVEDFALVADAVRESQKRSYIGSIANFLYSWIGPDEGFTRIFSASQYKNELLLSLVYRCLDPSVVSKSILEEAHSAIIMSGTLVPTKMYKDILGFPRDSLERIYKSPFKPENKLSIIIPETTTKFSMRSEIQFKEIAKILLKIIDTIPGNIAVFFPSYYLRDQIYKYLYDSCGKIVFLEQPKMTKKDKTEFLEKFKSYKDRGAVLLGASTGSFGEGIDLPGDLLNGVIVVGLPLEQPDLETKELIRYFDKKFGRGWDYGYIFPAFNKCLQNAGRCIRSETDKGVVVFLDKRYIWPMYKRCFPEDSDIKVTMHYKEMIEEFFKPKQRMLGFY